MNSRAYTEDQLVEQPAIRLFAELGWQAAGPPPSAGVADEPCDAGLLGRETKSEVVLVPRLRAALEKLNPTLPPEAIAAAIDELTRDRSAMLLEQANREVYRLLKEGIKVSVADADSTPGHTSSGLRPPSPQRGEGKGGQKTVRVRVVDWEQPAKNDFLLVSQFGEQGRRKNEEVGRLRRAKLFHRLSRQADAESHVDADHRARQPRVPWQAQRVGSGDFLSPKLDHRLDFGEDLLKRDPSDLARFQVDLK